MVFCAGKLKMGEKIIPVTVQQQKHFKLQASRWDLGVCDPSCFDKSFCETASEWPTDFDKKNQV